MTSPPPAPDDSALRATAAQWTIRRDRGLSASESIDYELWLAADPRHAAAMQRSSATWSLLDRIPETVGAPVLAAATRRRSFGRRSVVMSSLAAAAALALVALNLTRPSATTPSASVVIAPASAAAPRQLTLSDGTVVQLNAGFTPDPRRANGMAGGMVQASTVPGGPGVFSMSIWGVTGPLITRHSALREASILP